MADVSNASASASVEQAQGIAQVALGLRQIDEAVQRTSIAATQTEEAAHRMDREMRELRKLLPGAESVPARTPAEETREIRGGGRSPDVLPVPRAIVLDDPLSSFGPSSRPSSASPVDSPRRRGGETSESGRRRAAALTAPLEAEGDRVVRPGDRIVLDDREFGRY
jgi:hypothetical protein